MRNRAAIISCRCTALAVSTLSSAIALPHLKWYAAWSGTGWATACSPPNPPTAFPTTAVHWSRARCRIRSPPANWCLRTLHDVRWTATHRPSRSTAGRFLEPVMHTRIRKFNTRDTYPEQKLDNDLCQAVVARGRTVFVRGQVGQDLDTAA